MRPMGLWSMSTTLSKWSRPSIASWGAGSQAGAVEPARRDGVEGVVDQGGLARAGDAGDAAEGAHRDRRRRPASGCCRVAPRTRSSRSGSSGVRSAGISMRRSPLRYRPVSDAGIGGDLLRRALGDDLAAVHAGARAHVDHVVGAADGLLVVLHHDHRVAQVAQVGEGVAAGGRCRAGAGRWRARPGCT